MKRALSTLLASLFIAPLWAGVDTGADFLKIPIGSRAVAMGQAYTALAHDVDSMNWNPAGIASVGKTTLSGLTVSHQELFLGNTLDYAGFVFPVQGQAMGIDILRLSYAEQDERNADRVKTGSFGASDLMIGAALGTAFNGLKVGTHLKLIQQELHNEKAQGYALDLGVMSAVNHKLSLAATARNIGPSMNFIREEFDLPLTMSLGAAYRIKGPLTFAMDVHTRPRQKQMAVAFGTEFQARESFSLRAGYLARLVETISNTQKKETNRGNPSNLGGLNGGFGLRFEKFSMDYAFSPFGELGNTQSLTLSTWFGGSRTVPASRQLISETPIDAPAVQREIVIFNGPVADSFLNSSLDSK